MSVCESTCLLDVPSGGLGVLADLGLQVLLYLGENTHCGLW